MIGIDHVVLAVDDPDAAAGALQASLGLLAEVGGRHEALGTANRLVWLGDAYLELVGVVDRELAERSWFGRLILEALTGGGGLATWAIAVDDIDAHLRWLAGSVELTDPLHGERRRPDGRVVRWRLAYPSSVSALSPFLIEHDLSAAEWTPAEREARAVAPHPVGGAVRLVTLDVPTASPAHAAARLRTLVATSAEPDGRAAVRVHIGRQAVRFFAPRPDDHAVPVIELVADIPMRRRTARIGECEVRLRGVPKALD